jgi:23S rRNA pseudouridine1911/1915/1917 synthase
VGDSGETWRVGPEDAGNRLDKFLAATGRLGSRGRAARALDRGKIFLNDREAGAADAARRLAAGDWVRCWMDRPGSAKSRLPLGDLEIVFEDAALVVVNKPAGLLTVPLGARASAPSVYAQLVEHLRPRRRRPFVAHRIDRDTSGLVVFATTPEGQEQFKRQFIRHDPERVYLAVVYGHPNPPSGVWRDQVVWDPRALVLRAAHPGDPRKREAECEYRTIERLDGAALLEVRLRTGKRNQIRLQARLHGHVLVGERLYVDRSDTRRPIAFDRQALHAVRLAFAHPVSGRPMAFEAPLPEDLEALVSRLRRSS